VTDSEQQRHDLFLRLYVEHEESLRGFVRSLVTKLEDAREVMQDVAAVLWRMIAQIVDFICGRVMRARVFRRQSSTARLLECVYRTQSFAAASTFLASRKPLR
jgi:RNA polymerase sigma-70 factor (ECF subfamily)